MNRMAMTIAQVEAGHDAYRVSFQCGPLTVYVTGLGRQGCPYCLTQLRSECGWPGWQKIVDNEAEWKRMAEAYLKAQELVPHAMCS